MGAGLHGSYSSIPEYTRVGGSTCIPSSACSYGHFTAVRYCQSILFSLKHNMKHAMPM